MPAFEDIWQGAQGMKRLVQLLGEDSSDVVTRFEYAEQMISSSMFDR